ncbi:VWA domain-containing protein [Massilia sp. Leaf139]|uniref:VWA domain-containing protein n=1 Tax=Massilia sp. Leaf139 TaxID=1736272 RepID=UPI0007016CEA|nr:VWA domain-containing protein [Massilia sp. Leaf139]KQQ97160.1 hypothetical protein ASF77_04150 [Massilia sp. Leaf139]
MGGARWDADDWKRASKATAGKRTEDIFTSSGMHPSLNPYGMLRESRDSLVNPNSNAIIIALDVTGSMGMIADAMAREGLGTLVEEILKRQPVSDPHILACGIGDSYYDEAPLQATQFEADIRIADQLKMIWLEKGGGGNSHEGYHLPWYFAAQHTQIDCFEKRNRKGYLFTVGDEEPPEELLAAHAKAIFGDSLQRDLSAQELLTLVSRMYHVFHVVVEEGNHARAHLPRVLKKWNALLGQRVLRLKDYRRLAEVVVSAIEVNEGRDRETVAKSWSGDTSVVVAHALGSLPASRIQSLLGLVRF